jgi:hypothetical protein
MFTPKEAYFYKDFFIKSRLIKVSYSSDDFIGCYSTSLPKKTDEQSALNRILQETAT